MNTQIVGTCSICGGAVTLPLAWYSVTPPVATCSRCGAVAAQHGPVIPMVRPTHVPAVFGPETTPSVPWEWTAVPNTGGRYTTDTVTLTHPPEAEPFVWHTATSTKIGGAS